MATAILVGSRGAGIQGGCRIFRAAPSLPGWLAAACLHGITGTVRGLGGLRIADYRVAMPETSSIVIATGALAVAMVLAYRQRALAWRCWLRPDYG